MPINNQETLIPYLSAVSKKSPIIYSGHMAVYQPVYALTGQENSFQIYSVHNYPIPSPNSESQRILKVTLSLNNQVLIGYGGRPQPGVPGHHEMSSHCLFAGNITVNERGQIIKIDHFSAFFMTSFDSIAYLLCVLANYPNKLAPTITIEQTNDSGGFVRNFNLTREELASLANSILAIIQPLKTAPPIKYYREKATIPALALPLTAPLRRRARGETLEDLEDDEQAPPLKRGTHFCAYFEHLRSLGSLSSIESLSALLPPALDFELKPELKSEPKDEETSVDRVLKHR